LYYITKNLKKQEKNMIFFSACLLMYMGGINLLYIQRPDATIYILNLQE